MCIFQGNLDVNKKVLLCARKRRTIRIIACPPWKVGEGGYPNPVSGEGYPTLPGLQAWLGYPQLQVWLGLFRGTHLLLGYRSDWGTPLLLQARLGTPGSREQGVPPLERTRGPGGTPKMDTHLWKHVEWKNSHRPWMEPLVGTPPWTQPLALLNGADNPKKQGGFIANVDRSTVSGVKGCVFGVD